MVLLCKKTQIWWVKTPPAVRGFERRPPICVVSITLPRSPVSLSSGDEVPHIFTRKSRLQPGEFLITSAKRLLQHRVIPGSCHTKAQGISSPGTYEAIRCGLAKMESNNGALYWARRVVEEDIDLCGEPGGISRARGRSRFRS